MKTTIITFRKEYIPDFVRINKAWVEKYFTVEPADQAVFDNPEAIINGGGEIYFALLNNVVAGTCALEKFDEGKFELIKMGVDESARGQGIGGELMQFVIDDAPRLGAHTLRLETSCKLPAAPSLYRKFGFEEINAKSLHGFNRCDLIMERSV